MSEKHDIPFLRHHQKPLDEETFRNLRPDSFEQRQRPFVLDDIAHDFDEGFERLSLPSWGWPRLEAYFGDDEGLGEDCGDGFGEGTEDCLMLARRTVRKRKGGWDVRKASRGRRFVFPGYMISFRR